jgi:hypothetical protein
MVGTLKPIFSKPDNCPHCRRGFLVWDERDSEHFCFNFGWRHSIHVTAKDFQARRKWNTLTGLLDFQKRSDHPNSLLEKNFETLFAGLKKTI